jgi:hypothetical protein
MLKFKTLAPNIYAVEGTISSEVAKLFLRFQECYESPKFRDEIFTLKEFKKYYKEFTNSTSFTYYYDWVGFNVPGTIIDKFINGRFNPLTRQELWLVNQIKKFHKSGNRYYVIGYKKNSRGTLKHEMAHAKFHIYPQYRTEVLKVLGKCIPDEESVKLADHLRKMGYHSKVIMDEIHAYTLCEKSYLASEKLWSKGLIKAQEELEKIYKAYP